MPDRENAIRMLCIERECVSRDCDRECGKCDLAQDRELLLKAYDDALELLQEQEPVAPVLVPTGYGAGIVCNCGACGTELFALNGTNVKGVSSVVRFCRMCGKAVKWDE